MCFEISGLVQANEMRTTFIQKVLEAFDGKESLLVTIWHFHTFHCQQLLGRTMMADLDQVDTFKIHCSCRTWSWRSHLQVIYRNHPLHTIFFQLETFLLPFICLPTLSFYNKSVIQCVYYTSKDKCHMKRLQSSSSIKHDTIS